MSDYNSSLPIRTETAGDVGVKIVDKTSPTTQQMTVDSDSNAHVEIHGNDPTGTDKVVKLSEQGSVNIDGVYNASTNTDPSNIGIVAHVRTSSPSDSDQTKRLTAITNSTVHALDISLHDETGAAYTQSNPLPVSIEESEGTEVHDYSTSSAVAAAGTSNHDYTVASGIFRLTQVLASASGKLKIEIQIATDGVTFTTKAVLFNSTSNPNLELTLSQALDCPTSGKIRVIRTNKDLADQDLYSTIIGVLV
jgi:hypothetical protein